MSYTKMWEEIKAAEKAKIEPEKNKVTLKEWLAIHVESRKPDLISLPYIKADIGYFREQSKDIEWHRVRITDEYAWVGVIFNKSSLDKDGKVDEVLFRLTREEAEQLVQNLKEQLG